jgi:hypothetical protein
MAVTISHYNHTRAKLLDLGVGPEAANFYVELLDGDASFDATDTTKTAVDNAGGYEVHGNGWTEGGENAANVAVTVTATDEAMLDFDDIAVTATGGSIGPAEAALVWLDEGGAGTTKSPLWYVDFGEALTSSVGIDFEFNLAATGIFRIGDCA